MEGADTILLGFVVVEDAGTLLLGFVAVEDLASGREGNFATNYLKLCVWRRLKFDITAEAYQ